MLDGPLSLFHELWDLIQLEWYDSLHRIPRHIVYKNNSTFHPILF